MIDTCKNMYTYSQLVAQRKTASGNKTDLGKQHLLWLLE